MKAFLATNFSTQVAYVNLRGWGFQASRLDVWIQDLKPSFNFMPKMHLDARRVLLGAT